MSLSKKALNLRLQQAAAENAKALSNDTVRKVVGAMHAIDREIAANDNIYPHNGGKLNQRELCRRAGISFMTLQSPAHKETTRVQVAAWLEAKVTVTKKDAAKAVTGRVEHWKEQHRMVATQICVYELELKEKSLEIEKLRQKKDEEIQGMREQIELLRAQLVEERKGRVLSIVTNSDSSSI